MLLPSSCCDGVEGGKCNSAPMVAAVTASSVLHVLATAEATSGAPLLVVDDMLSERKEMDGGELLISGVGKKPIDIADMLPWLLLLWWWWWWWLQAVSMTK